MHSGQEQSYVREILAERGGISAALSNESFSTNFQWLPNIGLGFSSVTAIFDSGIRLPHSVAAAAIVPKRDAEPCKQPFTAPAAIARYNAFALRSKPKKGGPLGLRHLKHPPLHLRKTCAAE